MKLDDIIKQANKPKKKTVKVFYCNWKLATYLRKKKETNYGKNGTLSSTFFIMYMGRPFWTFENYRDIFKVGTVTEGLIKEFVDNNPDLIGDNSVIFVNDTRRGKYHYHKYDKTSNYRDYDMLYNSPYSREKQEEYWRFNNEIKSELALNKLRSIKRELMDTGNKVYYGELFFKPSLDPYLSLIERSTISDEELAELYDTYRIYKEVIRMIDEKFNTQTKLEEIPPWTEDEIERLEQFFKDVKKDKDNQNQDTV